MAAKLPSRLGQVFEVELGKVSFWSVTMSPRYLLFCYAKANSNFG
jgi:hypothetical protein